MNSRCQSLIAGLMAADVTTSVANWPQAMRAMWRSYASVGQASRAIVE